MRSRKRAESERRTAEDMRLHLESAWSPEKQLAEIQDPDIDTLIFADGTNGHETYGAGRFLVNPTYLLLAGKIVSVEARHAAAIRDIISYNSFADETVVDNNGLDRSLMPAEVLSIAGTYYKTKINASNLPK